MSSEYDIIREDLELACDEAKDALYDALTV